MKRIPIHRTLLFHLLLSPQLIFIAVYSTASARTQSVIHTEKQRLSYQIVTTDLQYPWSMAFLPSGDMLVTERGGQLRLVRQNGELHPQPIAGLPQIRQYGQGGLLDVVLHPDFEDNRWVYFSYAEAGHGGAGTAVACIGIEVLLHGRDGEYHEGARGQ